MRMATPIFPVMDNAFCDFYFFFVPNRLVWEHWKEFMGENKETAWTPKTEYSVPQVTAPAKKTNKGSAEAKEAVLSELRKATYQSIQPKRP
jgi:hypothetical protein